MTCKSFNRETGVLEFGERGGVFSCTLDEALDYSRWPWDRLLEMRAHLVQLGLNPPEIPESLRPVHPKFDPVAGVDKTADEFRESVGIAAPVIPATVEEAKK